ncbi:MAG TPA: lysoplasmalogenase [Burkholderiaceae bacterium]
MPKILTRSLPWLVAASALLTMLSQDLSVLPRELGWIFKPLTTILVMVYAWPRGLDTPVLRRFVLIGLACSLLGDVALMFPGGFVPGLLAFLAAHLAYLWAFTRVQRFASWPWSFAAYGFLAVSFLAFLWPGIPAALQVPVVAYVLCLGSMSAQAAVIAFRARGTPLQSRATTLALGGMLFFASDGLIAFNKFDGPQPLAALAILPAYWAAQWCIASWLAPEKP